MESRSAKSNVNPRSGDVTGFAAMPWKATPKIHMEPGPQIATPQCSWWIDASPRGFTRLAEVHGLRMRQSKEHFRIGLRILQ